MKMTHKWITSSEREKGASASIRIEGGQPRWNVYDFDAPPNQTSPMDEKPTPPLPDPQAPLTPPPTEQPPPPTAAPPTEPTPVTGASQSFFENEKNMAMSCHLSALIGGVVLSFTGLPIGNIIAPLILWLIKKDLMPLVNEHGKEVLNFQITVSIAIAACLVLFFLIFPLFLIPIIGIAALVLTIIGTIRASEGKLYRYPLTLRLIK